MEFIKQKPGQAVDYLSSEINKRLNDNQKVLWFLSGGSSIGLAVDTRRKLDKTENLTVMLIDERYGPDGHSDSNWKQLKDAGFDFSKLTAIPVLRGLPIEETTFRFQEELSRNFKAANFKLAIAGIGPDGHTSGILPGSQALTAPGLAAYYQGPDYQRITTTPKALAQLDEAVVSLSDQKKEPLIKRLQQDTPPIVMPAQLLKKLPRFIVFNDWIGDNL